MRDVMLRSMAVIGAGMAVAVLAAGVGRAYRNESEAVERARALTGGDPAAGRDAMRRLGCVACHTVPGVTGAEGTVGPPLDRWSQRAFIAGVLPNTPANLIVWIRWPQGVLPKSAMPNAGASEAESRDIAAFLYTLE